MTASCGALGGWRCWHWWWPSPPALRPIRLSTRSRPCAGACANRRAQGHPAATDRPRAVPGALSDRPLVRELSAGRDAERLVGRAARRNAEPRAGRRTWPAPAAERRAQRERRRIVPGGRHDRAERAAARRGRSRQPRPAGPGSGELQRAACAGAAELPLRGERRRRRVCRPRSQQSASRSVNLPMGWRPWCSRDPWRDDALVRRWAVNAAAAPGMPGLRTVPDDSRAGARNDRTVRALPDQLASRYRPSAGSQYRADRSRARAVGHHVHDHADERADGRHHAYAPVCFRGRWNWFSAACRRSRSSSCSSP